ncbi:nucleotidyltransferase domain-containing protein [Cyanobium sp. Cruz CV13-4-11]|uniref:nucleotidyltransferase domain-containing protein n=1 Tax=unclassified Cyanobium TaxID=2627006 RepID=UPI0020CD577D|nr:nucleotidyltransferase domain-containing protein [Cyanobium sp. Cruz CV13-4-11]
MGVFGSYGRGDTGMGSDLDLLLIDAEACEPQHQRQRQRQPLALAALTTPLVAHFTSPTPRCNPRRRRPARHR